MTLDILVSKTISKLTKLSRQVFRYYFKNEFHIYFPFEAYDFIVATKSGLFLATPSSYLKIMNGEFYGITNYNQYWFIFEAMPDLNVGRILRLSSNDGKVDTIMKGLSVGCHQIDFFCDNLFITDTYNNCIVKLNSDTLEVAKKFYPLGKNFNGRNSDNYAHINSIYNNDNSIYILCHNETSKTGRNSEIIICDKKFSVSRQIRLDAGNAHNIALFKDELILCDSNGSRVSNHFGKTLLQLSNFTRGLSITDDYIVVGESEYANRTERHKKAGWLNYCDHNWEIIKKQRIPGMVQEIRALNKIDYCLSSYQNT